MNRITLIAQLLGALVFVIAATSIADPATKGFDPQRVKNRMMGNPKIGEATAVIQKGREGWIEIIACATSSVEPAKLEFPNITANAGRQTLQFETEWTPGVLDCIDAFGRGGTGRRPTIVLKSGKKTFKLTNALITEVGFPDMQYNPKELSVDKFVAWKMEAEVADYPEGGLNSSLHKRPYHGDVRGTLSGAKGFAVTKVGAFRASAALLGKTTAGRQGSMKIELSRMSRSAPSWTDWNSGDPGMLILTLLDYAKTPLLTASFKVRKVMPLGDLKTAGRSLQCELMFDTFTLSRPRPDGPRPGRGG